jgi:hypothetical protein
VLIQSFPEAPNEAAKIVRRVQVETAMGNGHGVALGNLRVVMFIAGKILLLNDLFMGRLWRLMIVLMIVYDSSKAINNPIMISYTNQE